MLSLAAKQAVYVIFPHIPATVGWTNYFNVTVFPIAEKKKKSLHILSFSFASWSVFHIYCQCSTSHIENVVYKFNL